jgi:hypothetical protein
MHEVKVYADIRMQLFEVADFIIYFCGLSRDIFKSRTRPTWSIAASGQSEPVQTALICISIASGFIAVAKLIFNVAVSPGLNN